MPKARHFAPPLVVFFLGCTALSGVAQAGWFDSDNPAPAPVAVKEVAKDKPAAPAQSLDESIQQAQALRLSGNYPEAVKHLSQLMMVAADDPRVVSEYGKTLAQMGRAHRSGELPHPGHPASAHRLDRSFPRWAWPMTRSAIRTRPKSPMNTP